MAEINIERMAQDVAEKAIQELRDNGVFIGRWIPVSERLPEISGWYLVTGSRGAISVRYWRKAIPQQGGSYWRGSVNPIAWMPLPEPYVPDTNIGKMSENQTGSDDELYSDCIDAFKEYALGRK